MTQNDQQIELLLKAIEKQESEIKDIENPQYQTPMSYTIDGKRQNLKVKSVTIETLVHIYSELSLMKNQFNSSNKELGTNVVYEIDGYSVDKWLHDLKLRINKLTISKKRDELTNMKQKLETLMSDDVKIAKELEAIKSQIGI